jgi:hypothetical protein
VTFANPAAAWALLAIPAILLIHLLQRRSRRVLASTLFLLPPQPARSRGGRNLERLRASASLLLQLAAALLLAALLAQPRFLREESLQRVVLLLDASASMGAFRAQALSAIERRSAALGAVAARTEWVLLESDLRRPPLYSGPDRGKLLAAAAAFQPALPTHDLAPALDLAGSLAGPDGLPVLVTDHVAPLPAGWELLAVGQPTDDVGFTGVEVEGRAWRAVVRNHGRAPASRAWWIEQPAGPGPQITLTLGPGEARVLAGEFPAGLSALELRLTPDALPIDDRLPLVLPQPKPLRVAVTTRLPFAQRFLATLESATLADADADLTLLSAGPGPLAAPRAPAVVFLEAGKAVPGPAAPVVAESHPLTEGLSWPALIVPGGPGFAPQPDDHAFVWQGERRLLFLRGRALVVNFPLLGSNAERLPAFLLALHRHAEAVRRQKVAPEARSVETGEELEVAAAPSPEPRLLLADGTQAGGRSLRAPREPGFFRVVQGERVLLTAAAHFGDAREADLSQAASSEQTGASERRVRLRNSREHPLTPLALLALGALLVLDWRRG